MFDDLQPGDLIRINPIVSGYNYHWLYKRVFDGYEAIENVDNQNIVCLYLSDQQIVLGVFIPGYGVRYVSKTDFDFEKLS